MKLCWLLAILGLLGACEHGISLGDPKQAGGSPGASGGAVGTGGTPDSSAGVVGTGGKPDSSGGAVGTGGTLVSSDGGESTCRATCSTPAGTVQNTFSSQEEVYSIFVGQWQLCPGGSAVFPGIPSDVIGIEYDAPPDMSSNGNMYYLVQGSSGPVRGVGFDYQLTYNLYPEGGSAYQLDMYQSGGFGTMEWRYSPCPKELQIPQMYGSAKALLIPF